MQGVSFTFTEILAFMSLFMSIVISWIAFRVKVQKIETTVNLKFIELENKIATNNSSTTELVNRVEKQISLQNQMQAETVKGVKELIDKFLIDNKDEHREISHDIKGIRQSMQTINVKLAEIKAIRVTDNLNVKHDDHDDIF